MRKQDSAIVFWWTFVFWMIFFLIIRMTGFLLSFLILLLPIFIIVFVLINLYWIIKRNEIIKQYLQGHSEAHNRFFILFIVCSAKVLAVDGHVDQAGIQMVKNFFVINFGFSGNSLSWVEETLQKEFGYNRPIASLVVDINRFFDYSTKLALMDFLFRLAIVDSPINEEEKVVLNQFLVAIGITLSDQAFLRARYYSGSARNGYSSVSKGKQREHYLRILGLSADAKQDEIKAAYRKLVKKFHPDVVAHLGDNLRLASEKRMKEIQEAYEFLKDE